MLAQAVAAIALGLLTIAGVGKVIDPEPTTGAMRIAGLPSSRLLTRGIGLAEIGIGGWALTQGGMALWAAGLLYLFFAVFSATAIGRRLPIQSCGCFGREDTPPAMSHVVYNIVATLALVVVAVGAAPPVDWSQPTLELALTLSFVAIGIYASYLLLARLPQLFVRPQHS